jgi:phenylalanyl-tRNA synthetase alpha chain
MTESIALIKKSFFDDIAKASDAASLEKVRVEYVGRNGKLTAVLRSLGALPLEERKKIGPVAQALRKEMEEALDKKLSTFNFQHSTSVDLTAPGKKINRGHLHLLTQVENDIRRIFSSMNFSVIDGPELESEYYNFDALNVAPNHPARDMWDTFWIKQPEAEKKDPRKHCLLRTHTSPNQARFMRAHTPPFQIIVPGRVFRYEATDAGHEINFYQVEGLMVGKDVTLANFKFILEDFFKKFFKGKTIEFRYRPSYFPFTEPSVEVDIKIAGGKWLEMMGAGMVHPRVFEYAGYNPRDWRGFAFGMGLDRLAMIKYGVPDIRLFYSGDLRFIKQF